MLQVDINASVRQEFGKGAMRRLRDSGQTPAVLYGASSDALSLKLETTYFVKQLFSVHRKNAVVNLIIDGGTPRHVIVQELQTDPVRDSLVHADFVEIDLDKPKKFSVPVEYTGVAKGMDLGGLKRVDQTKVDLLGNPLDIPDIITVDISNMDIGESMTFADIAMPANVTMASKADVTCVAVDQA